MNLSGTKLKKHYNFRVSTKFLFSKRYEDRWCGCLKSNRSHFLGVSGFLDTVGKVKDVHMLCIKRKRVIPFVPLEILAYNTPLKKCFWSFVWIDYIVSQLLLFSSVYMYNRYGLTWDRNTNRGIRGSVPTSWQQRDLHRGLRFRMARLGLTHRATAFRCELYSQDSITQTLEDVLWEVLIVLVE